MSHYGNGGNNRGGSDRRDNGGWGYRSSSRDYHYQYQQQRGQYNYNDGRQDDGFRRDDGNQNRGSCERDYSANLTRNGSEHYHHGNRQRYGDRDGYHHNNRKREATYANTGAATKRSSQTHHNGESLTPQEQQVKMQLEELFGSVNNMSTQAFKRPEDWDEKVQRAMEATIVKVLAEKKKKDGEKDNGDMYDSDSEGYTPVGVSQVGTDETGNRLITEFIQRLPTFQGMMSGFHIACLSEGDLDKICVCPCSKKYGLEVGEDVRCDYITGKPNSLMDHLKKLGGLYEEKRDRKLVQIPLNCEYHYAASVFLREVYSDYYGSVGHKALYPVGTPMYRKALAAADCRKESEKQTVVRENLALKSEVVDLKKDLEKISEDLYKKEQRLEAEMKKFNVTMKEKSVLTDYEIGQYHDNLRCQFDQLRYLVCQGTQFEPIFEPVKVCVQPDQDNRASFSLQSFLDSLYDKNYNKISSAFSTKKDFERCWELFFGDICSVDEAKASKKKQTNIITMGLISEFNVIYTKSEAFDKTKGAKEQMNEDTAIDQGGPSRQFINDAILQMQSLSVPVGEMSVTLFVQETAGKSRESVKEIVPRLDDDLTRQVRAIAREKSTEQDSPETNAIIDDAMTRIKLYARVMGRILLHAFICGHPVSSAVMTPFFMNLLLRGVMPGDIRYDRGDIIRDLDGVLCTQSNELLSVWLTDGELDDEGNPWTTDTIFSKRIANEFIDTRSLILGGLIDGLSLRGKRDTSLEELHKGSELSGLLSHVPIAACSKILFARPNLSYDDVYTSLFAVYNATTPHKPEDWKKKNGESQENMDSYRQQQEGFYETVFLPYLREEAEQDCHFLSKFVECCTGSSCLPYAAAGSSPFQIKVEFNLVTEASAYPRFHTCEKELVLPGHVYIHELDSFREIMNAIIEQCRTKFDMQ